jgi:hypothetical protein
MVFDFAHFERRRMTMAHEIVDQSGVIVLPLGAAPIRYPRSLDNRSVVAHIIDDPDETVIEYRQWFIENIF